VKDEELSKLKAILLKIAKGYNKGTPKLTLLVAQKRNHLRCYAPDTPKGNPDPGTLISDPRVIDQGDSNFYLYSHKALAGTARPTHYQVRCFQQEFIVNFVMIFA
jgi:eukaryotic translation initiation factor 2C